VIALAWLWLSAPTALGADVCRGYDISEGNPDRGPSLVVSDGVSSLSRVDGRTVLRTFFYEGGAISQSVPHGTAIDWELADGSLVTLVSDGDAPPAAITYGGGEAPVGVNTRWTLAFVLPDDVLHAVARSPVRRVRYTLVSTPLDVKPKRSWSAGWQRLAACYANRIQAPTD
jgi:hypothetical protein